MRLRAGRKASEAAPSSDYFPSVMVRQAEGFVQQRGVCVCVCVCVAPWQGWSWSWVEGWCDDPGGRRKSGQRLQSWGPGRREQEALRTDQDGVPAGRRQRQ